MTTNKFLRQILVGLYLSLAASFTQAAGLTFEVQINYDTLLSNDADVVVTISGISNGQAFTEINPPTGGVWILVEPGDFYKFNATGSARSGPTSDFADVGDSQGSAQMFIIAFGPAADPVTPLGFVAQLRYEIGASGFDAFSNAALGFEGPYDFDTGIPLVTASLNASADSRFGDKEEFIDTNPLTFGGPLIKERFWFFGPPAAPLPPLDPAGVKHSEYTLDFFRAAAVSSEANYNVTMSFSVVPVPAAAWLFASALGLLGWMRRKAA